jgi:hypothetical protein
MIGERFLPYRIFDMNILKAMLVVFLILDEEKMRHKNASNIIYGIVIVLQSIKKLVMVS